MKMLTRHYFLHAIIAGFFLFCMSACVQDVEDIPVDEKTMDQLLIPSDFHFNTAKNVQLSFADPLKSGAQAKYFVYLYSDKTQIDTVSYINEDGVAASDILEMVDDVNDLVATRVSKTGSFELSLLIPEYVNKLYVRKNEMGIFSGQVVEITAGSAVFSPTPLKSGASDPVDVLYTVNGSGDLATVNPTTGEMEIIEDMPMGSWTAALDVVNRNLYFVGRSKPYPIYKYNLDSRDFAIQGNLGMGGPRLDFNHEEGLLYFSTGDMIYKVNPENAEIISVKRAIGIHNLSGGDLAFDDEGVIYLSSFSGLYRLDDAGANYDAVRISGEGLPFNPTSMTFDSNNELWLAHVTGSSSLVVMDKVTGGWETRYENLKADINDLTTLPFDEGEIQEVDTDDDTIIDFYDEFPNDPDKAYVTYTPSVYGLGSLVFEDLWPAKGDYDFNDMVLNYKFIMVSNHEDKVVELIARLGVKNIGGSLHNGFGFSLPFDKSIIESVSGYQLSKGIVTVDGKGLETGQTDAVIIVFEDAFLHAGETIEIVIKFTSPTDTDVIGLPPFDPFVFIGENRGRELHLSDYPPTDLHDPSFFNNDQDNSNPSIGRYYKAANGLPWAIHIIHDFTYPVEKAAINNAYLMFNRWAESGGIDYPDWYKDDPGFRNTSLLTKD